MYQEILMRSCDLIGCNKKHEARGLCNGHYVTWSQNHKKKGWTPEEFIRWRNEKTLKLIKLAAQDLKDQEGEI